MVQTRRQRTADGAIPLRQPDRTAPPPSAKTLLDIAHERNLFRHAAEREREMAAAASGSADKNGMMPRLLATDSRTPAVLAPAAERILEAALWTATIAMLHFTFDVLVQSQYGREIEWSSVVARTARAWAVFLFLFYFLHAFEPNGPFVPGLAPRHQRRARQAVFFVVSVAAGCSLVHVTNAHGYLATMKKAPPLGCLWLWAVVELDLAWGCASLLVAAAFVWAAGYHLV